MAGNSFERDRLTKITYAQIAAISWFIFGLGPAFALLREDLGITRTEVAFHNVAGSIGSMLAGVTSTYLIKQFGRGNVIRGGAVGMVLGLTTFVTGPTIFFTLPGALICGYSGILIIQCNAAFLNKHHGDAAPAVVSEVNALGALVGFLSPIALGIGVAVGFGWRIGLGSVVLAFIAIEFWRGKSVGEFGLAKTDADDDGHDKAGPLPKIFWSAWLAAACTAAIEASTLTWGSELLKVQSGFKTATATAAVGLIVLGMGIGRFIGARLMVRRDVEKIYRQSLFLSLISYVVFWQSKTGFIQLIAMAALGLLISVHFPLGITRLMRASHGRPDRAVAMSSIGSGAAAGFVPFFVGAAADQTNIVLAFVIPGLALVGALVLATINPVPAVGKTKSEIGL